MELSVTEYDNRRQLEGLYLDHHGWLHGWLSGRLGCQSRGADLAQDTFMRLLVNDSLASIEEPRAFLTTVAQRVLANHWRRERIEKAYLEVLALQPEQFAPSAEEKHLLLETLEQIDEALDGLPLVVRQAFFYAQLEGMKYAEIARRLDISVSTVKRYLVRASGRCYFALDIASETGADSHG